MIYTWRCTKCKKTVDCTRSLSDMDIEPTQKESPCSCRGPFVRILSQPTPVMFEKAYDSGVLERVWKHPNL